MFVRPVLLSAVLALSLGAAAQDTVTAAPAAPILHVLKYTAPLPAGPETTVRISLYREATGGEALWSEVQHVTPDASGKTVLLVGAATENGIPQSVFDGAEARFVGVAAGEAEEQPRTLLAPSAYALKAADAETLGGHPVSDFALAGVKPKPDTGTDITQINVSSGILGGGTGPTVALAIDPTYFNNSYAQLTGNNLLSGNDTFSAPWASSVATGTAPFTVQSTTVVTNLNAGLLGGTAASGYPKLATQNTYTANQIYSPLSPATTATGHSSNFIWLNASVWNSTKNAAQSIGFQFRAEPLNNDTASPNANLSLLSTVNSATPQETGFKITANGLITFTAAQTFPGTAQVGAKNTYTMPQTINSTETISGSAAMGGSAGAYTGQLTVTDSNASGAAVVGNSGDIGVLGSGLVGLQGFGTTTDNSVTGLGTGLGVIGEGGVGVYGQGTYTGSSYSSFGVWGAIDADYPATGPIPVGVYGGDLYTIGYGVYGVGPTGGTYGASDSGNGSTGLSTDGTGVLGSSESGPGMRALSDSADGLDGSTYGAAAYGVNATNYATSGGGAGLYAFSASNSGYAINAINTGASTTGSFIAGTYGAAVWADTNLASTYGPALYATADDNFAAIIENNSNAQPALFLSNSGSGGNSDTAAPVFATAGKQGSCNIDGKGSVMCSGSLKTAVPVSSTGRQVEVYSVQSAENWFEDVGTAKLDKGAVHVALDPQFAAIVNTGVEYHVFLTPRGDSEGLYVTETGVNGFDVRESHHGTSSIAFDYRILAKRTGHESERLADATEAMERITGKRDRDEKLRAEAAAHPRLQTNAHRVPVRPTLPSVVAPRRTAPQRLNTVAVKPAAVQKASR